MTSRSYLLAIASLSASLLALCLWAYLPGLHGGFLFDDFGNLPILGDNGPVDNWATFWRYITSGQADPTGRPMALLSFLLDAQDWPASPYPFKRTNLIIHLLNGALLAALLRTLGRLRLHPSDYRRNDLASVLGAGLWLLHPLFVSTTLYIVQREAMLVSSFTLAGLLLWLHGRHDMLNDSPRRGLCWILLGLLGCTVLAALCKANGVLLPALALVIECVWLKRQTPRINGRLPFLFASFRQPPHSYHLSMLLLASLPTLLLGLYLLRSGWSGFVHGVSAVRPWTMGQRLLTEPRVLMDYLQLLWLPRPFTPGVFNDQIVASTSLTSPATTLTALLAVLGLILGACCLRNKFPALAFVIIFYFVGQSMESTTLPLELYFEHRNYLPAMLMFWPLSLWLVDIRVRDHRIIIGTEPLAANSLFETTAAISLKRALAFVVLFGLASLTHANAELWGDTRSQAQLWAKLNPSSARAQANAALVEMDAGKPRQAIARLIAALPASPDQVQLSFNLIGAHCMLGYVPASDFAVARRSISRTRDPGTLLEHWFDASIQSANEKRCHGLDLNALDSLLDDGLANPKLVEVGGRHQDLLYLKGHIALARRDPEAALIDFDAALDFNVRPDAALNQAALLGAAGYPREGLAHLDYFRTLQVPQTPITSGMPWLHSWVLQQQNYWQDEIGRLRVTLQKDSQAKVAGQE